VSGIDRFLVPIAWTLAIMYPAVLAIEQYRQAKFGRLLVSVLIAYGFILACVWAFYLSGGK